MSLTSLHLLRPEQVLGCDTTAKRWRQLLHWRNWREEIVVDCNDLYPELVVVERWPDFPSVELVWDLQQEVVVHYRRDYEPEVAVVTLHHVFHPNNPLDLVKIVHKAQMINLLATCGRAQHHHQGRHQPPAAPIMWLLRKWSSRKHRPSSVPHRPNPKSYSSEAPRSRS